MHSHDLFLLNLHETYFKISTSLVILQILIDLDDHMGPVAMVCLSKAPNFKIKRKLVLRYLAALGS